MFFDKKKYEFLINDPESTAYMYASDSTSSNWDTPVLRLCPSRVLGSTPVYQLIVDIGTLESIRVLALLTTGHLNFAHTIFDFSSSLGF